MNYLEAYDKESGYRVHEYRLTGIELADLKLLLGIDPELEVFGYDVPDSLVAQIGKYAEGPVIVDESCDYQVGFFRQ
ncbi:DUF7683 domain-containing protein [Rhodococcus gannanensis]|uniref:DUF7683 domain-containing protein n=1 Tax=Rhodococcus gannanensis TaxID=1960308 RepID=A0ABW4P8Z1_9NOCA